jgi:hypothetical protein
MLGSTAIGTVLLMSEGSINADVVFGFLRSIQ